MKMKKGKRNYFSKRGRGEGGKRGKKNLLFLPWREGGGKDYITMS